MRPYVPDIVGSSHDAGRPLRSPSVAGRTFPGLASAPFSHDGARLGRHLLTDHERQVLARIATRQQAAPREWIYREGAPADFVFAIGGGAVKTVHKMPDGKRSVTAFLFANDLFGLAEDGTYLNGAQAISQTTLYRLPLDELFALVKRDPTLQFKFLLKVADELRESQRRTAVVARKRATERLAMFLTLIRRRQPYEPGHERHIPLPMTRTDIAGFLGLSREALSRAATHLERLGLVRFEAHAAHILDKSGLGKLANRVG